MSAALTEQTLDLARRIEYLRCQHLSCREQQWIRENRISLIVELAAQRGYHQSQPQG